MMRNNSIGIFERLRKKFRGSASRAESSGSSTSENAVSGKMDARSELEVAGQLPGACERRIGKKRHAHSHSQSTAIVCSVPGDGILPLSQPRQQAPLEEPLHFCDVKTTRGCSAPSLQRVPVDMTSVFLPKKEPSLIVIDTCQQVCNLSRTSGTSTPPSTQLPEDCSLLSASDSGLYSEADSAGEDDFLEVFSDDEDDAGHDGDSWSIPAQEVSLDKLVVSNTHESIYSGYWHGNVSVHARNSNTTERQRRILADVNALKHIRHENVQLFLGVCHDLHSDYISIVMDQMKGLTLHTIIYKQGHKFNFQSLTRIVNQISQGLDYLHAKGISHPLLTSQSVTLHYRVCISMLTPGSASMGLIRTSDLPYLSPESMRTVKKHSSTSQGNLTCPSSPHSVHGLRTRCISASRLLYGLPSSPSSTRSTPTSPNIKSSRRLFESAGYLSPGYQLNRRGSCDDTRVDCANEEKMIQLRGSRKVMQNPEANVFSFGTLLYELITLEKPYQYTNGNMIIYQVSKGVVQDLRHLRDGVFKQTIKRCWRNEATSRPSFKDLLDSFEQNMSPMTCGLTKSHFSFSVPNHLDKIGSL